MGTDCTQTPRARCLPPMRSGYRGLLQRYILTGDEYTGFLWVEFGQRKSDATRLVLSRVNKINNKHPANKVVEHQTDGGTEFRNKVLDRELGLRDVEPRNSAPHCQYQNGWIEKRMGEIDKGVRALMFRGNAPEGDYPYALRHWVWLNNVLPHPVTGLSPWEKKYGIPPPERPNTIRGKLFCKCMAKLYVHGVLQRDAVACIYLGKDGRTPGSLVRVIGGKKRGKEIRSAQIVSFDIDTFPYSNQTIWHQWNILTTQRVRRRST